VEGLKDLLVGVKLVLGVVLPVSTNYALKLVNIHQPVLSNYIYKFNLYRDQVLLIAKILMSVLSFLVYAVTGAAKTPSEVLHVNVVKDTLWMNLESAVLV